MGRSLSGKSPSCRILWLDIPSPDKHQAALLHTRTEHSVILLDLNKPNQKPLNILTTKYPNDEHLGARVSAFAFGNGTTAATGDDRGGGVIWDIRKNFEKRGNFRMNYDIEHLDFSPSGDKLLAVGVDAWHSHVAVWDVKTLKLLKDYEITRAKSKNARFLNEPDTIAFCSDHEILIQNFNKTEPTHRLVHKSVVDHFEYDPKSHRIISITSEKKLHLWDAEKGTALGPPTLLDDPVVHFIWKPGSKYCGIGFANLVVKRWSVEDHRFDGMSAEHNGELSFFDLSEDGRIAALGTNTGFVQLLDASTGEPLAHTCKAATAQVDKPLGFLAKENSLFFLTRSNNSQPKDIQLLKIPTLPDERDASLIEEEAEFLSGLKFQEKGSPKTIPIETQINYWKHRENRQPAKSAQP